MAPLTCNIVVSVYNEEAGITAFSESLLSELAKLNQYRFNVIWVNDGSQDRSQELIEAIGSDLAHIEHTKILFSRNFGHEAAMLAGIDHALEGPLICMDADGQHPPEKIGELLAVHESGVEIVLTQRLDRADGGIIKTWMSKVFYGLMNKLSTFEFEKNSSDYFLVSDKVTGILKSEFRERNRFIRGFIQALGFRKETVTFSAPKRQFGESNYSFFGLLKLSMDAVFSFSDKPLRLTISVSLLFILFTLIFGCYSLYVFFFEETPPSGYTSIVLFLSASFSILFVTITVLSLYFEKALKEIRKRPIYIIRSVDKSGREN